MRLIISLVCAGGLILSNEIIANESSPWPRFRGENGSGHAATDGPTEFGPGRNQLWSVELPPGHSSPCVWGKQIFLTGCNSENKELKIIAVDRSTGKILWRRSVAVKELERGHPSFNPASSTPTTDGERVCVYFGSFGLLCFSVNGNKLWDFPLPVAKSYSGNATSPIMEGDKVILYRANSVDNFLIAVDKQSGKKIWRKRMFSFFRPSHSCAATPVVTDDNIVIHCIGGVQAHNINSGEAVWRVSVPTTATSSPVLANGHVFVATWTQTGEPDLLPQFSDYATLVQDNDKNNDGTINKSEFPQLSFFHRPEGADAEQTRFPLGFRRVDSNRDGQITDSEWSELLKSIGLQRKLTTKNHGLLSIQLGGHGSITESHVKTLEERAIAEVPTPVFFKNRIYMVKNGGILTCIDLNSGQRAFQKRLGGPGTHYASPIVAGHKLYLASGSGEITVIDISDIQPERLARNELQESIFATPAIVDGTLYVRTEKRLFAFGKE